MDFNQRQFAALEWIENKYELSEREIQVVRGVCQAMSNKAIGELLGISEETVKNHLKKINKRLGIKSRAHLILMVMGRALTTEGGEQ